MTTLIMTATLFVAFFLCALNALLAVMFRKRGRTEILSYSVVGLVELAIFVFVLLLRLGILTHVPYRLPPGLPFSRTDIGATIAVAIGLFPAAYWHRTTVAQVRQRIALDAQTMKQREATVRARGNSSGEWMN